MRPLVSIFALAALMLPSPALAWGQTGHRVIGEIADDRISGRTKAEIDLLLVGEDLAEVSTWADEERSNPTEFWQEKAGSWHYVTVPVGSTYAETAPPTEGDAITALKQFTETLRDPDAEPDQRRLALHFIVHIVGDLHQPLHAGNGTDRGGNDELVQWYGQDTNLHAVWDTHIIDNQKLSYIEYSKWLARQIARPRGLGPGKHTNQGCYLSDTLW